jgi:adenylosuccinate synthase
VQAHLKAKLAAGFPHVRVTVTATSVDAVAYDLCRFNVAMTRRLRRGGKAGFTESATNGRYYGKAEIPVARTTRDQVAMLKKYAGTDSMIEVLVPDQLTLLLETAVYCFSAEDCDLATRVLAQCGGVEWAVIGAGPPGPYPEIDATVVRWRSLLPKRSAIPCGAGTGWSSIGCNMKSIVLLSGPIAVGKSSVAKELVSAHGFRVLRTSPFLLKVAADRSLKGDRAGLQDLGDGLDRDTDFRWVIDDVAAPALVAEPDVEYWLLDSARKKRQVDHFRARFGNAVLHVHLTAAEDVLEARYESRRTRLVRLPSYASAIAHPNEVSTPAVNHTANLRRSGHQPRPLGGTRLRRHATAETA